MDLSMHNGYYFPPIHGSEGVPLFYQNPNVAWFPQILECQIPHGPGVGEQLIPYPPPPHCNPDISVIPNLIHFAVPPGANPEQEPQPAFCLAQRILPQSFPNLPNLAPITLTPPTQPYLFPEPVTYSAFQQQPSSSSAPPFRFVNIEIPESENTQPYIVSIPVPVSEFAPMSYSGQQPSSTVSSTQATPSQMAPCPSPSFPPFFHSLWGHTHFTGGRGLGRRKKPQVPPTRSSSEDSGSSRGNARRGGGNGFRYVDPCKLCYKNKETKRFCHSHTLRDANGKITCPILRVHVCQICGATGDNAHTLKYCPARHQPRRGGSEGEPVNQDRPETGLRAGNPGGRYKPRVT